MQYGMNNLWPTPIMYDRIEEQTILDNFLQEIFMTINLDNTPSDYKSDGPKYDLIAEGGDAAQEFKDKIIIPKFEKYLNNFGESLTDLGDYRFITGMPATGHKYHFPAHSHREAIISATFYLSCEEQNNGGGIEFMDPRTNADRGYKSHLKELFGSRGIQPKSGDILMFPSFAYHYTIPFYGTRRIVLGVDLEI
jgi:hypothetical protein